MDQEFLELNVIYLSLQTFILSYSEWLESQVELNERVLLISQLLDVAQNKLKETEAILKSHPLWKELDLEDTEA